MLIPKKRNNNRDKLTEALLLLDKSVREQQRRLRADEQMLRSSVDARIQLYNALLTIVRKSRAHSVGFRDMPHGTAD